MINCEKCSLYKQSKVDYEFTNILEGRGNKNSKIVIVFESLFYSDVKEQQIFTDKRYQELLQNYLQKVEIDINSLYFTSLIKCYLADPAKKPTKIQRQKCFENYLKKEIEEIKPAIIITIGNTVSKFFSPEVTNLRQAVGNYFYSNIYNCYCLPMFSLHYLSNLSPYAPQLKQANKAFQKIKYLLTKTKKETFDFSYSSSYEDLKKLDKIISVDFETSGKNYLKDKIVTVGISDLKRNIVFDTDEINWNVIAPELQKRKIVGQNFIYDLLFAKAANLDLDDCFFADTRVMQFLLNRLGATSLGYMTQVYFGYGYKDEGDISKIMEWSKEERKIRCVRDNYFQIRLFYKLYPKIKEIGSLASFKILSQILIVLADMEYKGILVDKKRLEELIVNFNNKKLQAEKEFKKRLNLSEDFNLNSSKQLSDLLYKQLNLPVIIKTKKGNESSNQKALELAAKSKPILNRLLKYREYKGDLEKLNLYKESIKEDGRIHSSFNTFSPRSSRAMSAKPNLQNVTGDSPLKEIFIAPRGYSYLYFDFKSLEFVLWAIVSGDKSAIRFIKEGKDIHRYVASLFYKKPEENVTDTERKSVKSVVYGSIYGADAAAVAYNTGVDVKFAESIQRIFFQLCKRGYFWIKETEQNIIKTKKVRTIFGTVKEVQDLELAKEKQKKHLIDSAKNFIIQSTGGELGFIAMIKIHKALKANKLDAHFIHNIHDGNIIEIKNEHLQKGIEIVKKYANDPIKLSAPIRVDIKVGASWANLKSIN